MLEDLLYAVALPSTNSSHATCIAGPPIDELFRLPHSTSGVTVVAGQLLCSNKRDWDIIGDFLQPTTTQSRSSTSSGAVHVNTPWNELRACRTFSRLMMSGFPTERVPLTDPRCPRSSYSVKNVPREGLGREVRFGFAPKKSSLGHPSSRLHPPTLRIKLELFLHSWFNKYQLKRMLVCSLELNSILSDGKSLEGMIKGRESRILISQVLATPEPILATGLRRRLV